MDEVDHRTSSGGALLRVHLGLGTNLGDRWGHLARALERLRPIDDELVVSPVYETAPVGGPAGQEPYLNCVVRLQTGLDPGEVLGLAKSLEAAAGREREIRWGPRTLDVDVLLLEAGSDPVTATGSTAIGGRVWTLVEVATDELQVPHPRLGDRVFVLAPLEDVSPELVERQWRERLGGAEAVGAAARRVGEIVVGAR